MGRHTAQTFGDTFGLPVVVVDAVNQRVLKGNAASGLPEVVVTGVEERFHVVGAVDGHQFCAGFVIGRVKGDGERQLQTQFGEAPDTRDKSAGG